MKGEERWCAPPGPYDGCAVLPLLLLLLGCRRDELAEASWDEFELDKRQWVLPRQRSKNDKEHITWLSEAALSILRSLPTFESEAGYLFTTNGRTPVSGFGRARERLAAAMPWGPPFTLHDLRRSFASGCAELGVSEHIVDRCLNHSGRKVSGVARIYNRSEYLLDRQAALNLWSKHVIDVVRPKEVGVPTPRDE